MSKSPVRNDPSAEHTFSQPEQTGHAKDSLPASPRDQLGSEGARKIEPRILIELEIRGAPGTASAINARQNSPQGVQVMVGYDPSRKSPL